MYAENGLQFPFLSPLASPAPANQYTCYSMNLPPRYEDTIPGFQQVDRGTQLQMEMFQAEYDLGAEGDLFKAPEAITEEPVIGLDPITAAAMSIISCGDDILTAESIQVADMESIRNDHLSDVFYECQKDLLEKSMIQEQVSELLDDVNIPEMQPDEGLNHEEFIFQEDTWMQKSVSSGCLNTMDYWICGYPNFLGFQGLDFEAFGMRRAYSEGDIQNLCNKNTSMAHPSNASEQNSIINNPKIEERRQKLSRYLKKKAQRNFGRKIKYACRKALADSQPRVRGRFAKNEYAEASRTKTTS